MTPQADVILTTMPYAHVMRPSIALGILKSCLKRGGIRCAVEYANLHFLEDVGLEVNGVLMQLRIDTLIGEWTFAEAAFRHGGGDLDRVLGSTRGLQPSNLPGAALDEKKYKKLLRQIRDYAPLFVEKTCDRILAKSPRIVGCSSTFEQHCPALAVLRRLKERAPEIITLMGGANCEAEMGWATIKNCPWVDYVVSGEAEEIVVPLCESILEERDLPPLHGLLTRAHVAAGRSASFPAGKIPRAILSNMEKSPEPDFDEYFEFLESSPMGEFVSPGLAVESSRGCWWGAKSHCTFCGLNGSGMDYRSKPAAQVLAEWEHLIARYGVRRFNVVDNIIDVKHIRELLPQLSESAEPYELFYEVKANLKREQVELMARAGVSRFQPGIEGLHDDLLKLMAKGNSATINLELLKFARDYGIATTWMLLVGFPGEDPAWHSEVAQWLPQIFHLKPPGGVVHIRYHRFSVYYEEPEKYGLRLEPLPSYREVYPFPAEDLRDLAYFFYDANDGMIPTVSDGALDLARRLKEWIAAHQRDAPPVCCYDDDGSELRFLDTRSCATKTRHQFGGVARDIYLACDTSKTREGLQKRFAGKYDDDEVTAAIDDFLGQRLMLELHGRLLSLANTGSVPSMDFQKGLPGGYMERFDRRLYGSLREAWEALRDGSPKLEKLLARKNPVRP